jgi:hypothetical protein
MIAGQSRNYYVLFVVGLRLLLLPEVRLGVREGAEIPERTIQGAGDKLAELSAENKGMVCSLLGSRVVVGEVGVA